MGSSIVGRQQSAPSNSIFTNRVVMASACIRRKRQALVGLKPLCAGSGCTACLSRHRQEAPVRGPRWLSDSAARLDPRIPRRHPRNGRATNNSRLDGPRSNPRLSLSGSPTQQRIKAAHRRVRSKRVFGGGSSRNRYSVLILVRS